MIEYILVIIERAVVDYGFWGVFLAAFAEEVISIIPSAAVIMFAGFFIMAGSPIDGASFVKLLLQVSLPVALGLTIGSLLVYGVVYWLGKPAIERFGKFVGISWKDIEKIRVRMRGGKTDELILFLVRATPVVPFSVVNAFCGLVRWRLRDYLIITFSGAFVRASIIAFIGWQFGRLYKTHLPLFERLESMSIFIFAICLITFLLYRRFRKRETVNTDVT